MNMIRHTLTALALGALFAAAASAAPADLPPEGKTVRMIVPFAPGGTSDILGRKLADELGKRIGRTVIVDNRAGAGGSLGTEVAVHGEPDGSVILMHSGAISVDPALTTWPSFRTTA